jgi:hypothetical protein
MQADADAPDAAFGAATASVVSFAGEAAAFGGEAERAAAERGVVLGELGQLVPTRAPSLCFPLRLFACRDREEEGVYSRDMGRGNSREGGGAYAYSPTMLD